MHPAKLFLPLFGLCVALIPVVDGPRPSPSQSSISKAPEHAVFGSRKGKVALKPAIAEVYGKLPLSFEPNRGQTDSSVKFLSRGRGYTLFLTRRGEAVLVLHKSIPKRGALRPAALSSATIAAESEPVDPPAVMRMKLVGEKTTPQVEGLDQSPGNANYFIGNDPKKWRTNVPTYRKVRYREVYPGVDLVYYGNQHQLENDFIVSPGADPSSIVLDFAGGEKLLLDARGRLVLRVKEGRVRFEKPRVYQDVGGARREISGSYVLKSAHRAAFAVGAYDASEPLVIDPVLSYSTYLGGGGDDFGAGIAVDSSGSAYVTGGTNSTNFPTANPLQAASAGSPDAFVAKLNATGSALVYSTYLGGGGNDFGSAIAVDTAGNAYVTGITDSTDFPTANPLQAANGGNRDAFVAKLNATGSTLVYSTYLGGSNAENGTAIAADAAGNAYVTGWTQSPNFPTANPFQAAYTGGFNAFVAKLNSTGSTLVYSTYLGGSGGNDQTRGIAVDGAGNAYVTGNTNSTNFPAANPLQAAYGGGAADAFVAKLNPIGSALVYSTYLGGGGDDAGTGIAVDPAGNAYVTGNTDSSNFPTANPIQATYGGGSFDAFVAKLNAAGSALVYSTYLGGTNADGGYGIAVDSSGNAYVSGYTQSTDFPTANPIQAAFGGGSFDAFVAKVDTTGSTLAYSTYLGGSGIEAGNGIAVDSSGNAYVTGQTNSTDFPTANPLQAANAGSYDAFVAKICAVGTPAVVTASVSPSILWPPNGKSVAVTVSGAITGGGCGINAATAAFAVVDEYGLVQPSGPVTLGPGGSYSFAVSLVASRNGNDKDGRQYTITVSAHDNVGNVGFASAIVTVPHDQGH
jgi:hypothetical protein